MKARVKSSGEIIEVKEWRGASNAIYSTPDMNMFYADNELEIIPDTTEQVTIVGWVARDCNGPRDLGLRVYSVKPKRYDKRKEWNGHGRLSYLIDHRLFPEVTWESEPKRVRITLTPMEE